MATRDVSEGHPYNYEAEADRNDLYRKVVATTDGTFQVVAMCVAGSAGIVRSGGKRVDMRESIPLEVHDHSVQMILVVRGSAEVVVGEPCSDPPVEDCCGPVYRRTHRSFVSQGDLVVVPAGQPHEVVVKSKCPLRLLVTYTRAEHEADHMDVRMPRPTKRAPTWAPDVRVKPPRHLRFHEGER